MTYYYLFNFINPILEKKILFFKKENVNKSFRKNNKTNKI